MILARKGIVKPPSDTQEIGTLRLILQKKRQERGIC
nr:MAG TPA: hypothetical protein [Caudoviricetes sp.]